jgi:tetratricopeptide (TPR) repeat protein
VSWREDLATGIALEQAGDVEAALDMYFMTMIDPHLGAGRTEVELHLLRALLRLDRGDEARVIAEPAARRFREHGDREGALAYARIVTAAAPASAEAWFDLATDLEALGRLPDAIDAVARCVALEPNQGDGWYNLACYRALVGDADGALEALGLAVRIAPANARLAVDDADFATIRSDPRFLAATA